MKRTTTYTLFVFIFIFVMAACRPLPGTEVAQAPKATATPPAPTATATLPATATVTAMATATAVPTQTPFTIDNSQLTIDNSPTPTPIPDQARPQISSSSPVHNLNGRYPTITLTFNQDMDQASVEANLSIWPQAELAVSWQSQRILVIEAVEALEVGRTYTVRIEEAATNHEGIPFYKVQTRTYTVPKTVNYYTVPGEDTPLAPIIVHFNYEMDTAVTTQQFQIEPAAEGNITWDETGQILTFTPDEPLAVNTTYTVHFEGVLTNANGDALSEANDHNFTTPSLVASVEPDGYSIPPTDPLRITFSRPVNQSRIADAFAISPDVKGTITWEENVMIFTPVNGRFPDFTYFNITLNLPEVANERWYFRTSHYADVADFGDGPNVQVVDANGRRAIHYRGYDQGVQDVTFHLYQLTPEQFVARYASGSLDTSTLLLARTWDEQTHDEGDYYLDPQELIIPADVPVGAYILDLSSDFVNDSLFVLLTEHGVVGKVAPGQMVVWTADYANNAASSLEVTLYDGDGRRLTNAQTDSNGLATLTLDETPLDSAFLIARTGNDVSLTGFDYNWRRSGYQRDQADYLFHISTDRPIYRPGHTVYFKAIVRQNEDVNAVPVPEGTAVTARIRDARGNTVQTFDLIANDYGTVNGQFQLGEGAMLGEYNVLISLAGASRSQVFKVEDYRKPDHAVTLTTNAPDYLTGETIEVEVDSQYFLGEPVANAEVVVTLYRSWGGDEGYEERVIEGRTDGDGRFSTTFTPQYEGSYIVEAVVDDGSHQGVSGRAHVYIHKLAESISLERGRYIKTPYEPFSVDLAVQDILGEAVANRRVVAELRRYDYRERSYQTLIDSFSGTTDGNGRFTAALSPEEPGYYRIVVTATDKRGQRIENTSWILAYHHDYWGSWYGRSDNLEIFTDKESYHFDDTAQLFVETSVSGQALLTLERGNVLEQRLVELTAPLTVLEIPLNLSYAPNVHATLQLWQPISNSLNIDHASSTPDARLLVASVDLDIPASHKKLDIAITPDKAEYAPGDTATITLRTTNFTGDPVSAEIALAVVDEAIFSLSPDLTPGMHGTFYFHRANQIVTYDSMRPLRSLWNPDAGGMGGGGGGDGGFVIGRPRSDFQDTAAWFPVLRTNANGEVTVSFKLPDDLTSWRLTARAVTADTQVGENTANITTKKEIVVRPLLPRTLTAGDNLILSTIIHNYGDQTRTLSVELTADSDNFVVNGAAVQSVTIPADGQIIVGWPIAVPEAGTMELTISAHTGPVGDSVRLPLTIHPLAIPDMTTQVGQFTGEFNTAVEMPAEALPMSTVTIDLSRSIAGSLLDGAEYLTGYPYGCVEQTMSRALPNAVVGRALFQLGIGDPARFAELEPMIQASIQRLYGFQHHDGGWGWWYSDPTHDYQTAWVVFGLAVTADAGYEIDPGVIERGANWLNENLSGMDIRTRAFALYSMAIAGQGNLEETLALSERLDELDTFSRAGLALALWELGETAVARQTVDMLIETATVAGAQAYWTGSSNDGYYRQKTMASDTRNTALALSAISQIRPGHALEGSIVRWLMAQRRDTGWGTTNETAFALLALTDHLLAQPNTTTDTEYTVWLNGEVVESGTLGRGRPSTRIEIPATAAQSGSNDIRISQSGGGQLYYVINNRVYVGQAEIEAAGVIEVDRTYLNPANREAVQAIQPGDVVLVQLAVRVLSDTSYVIVEDKLPGGFEALNEQLANTSVVAHDVDDRSYTYKETRGDRVSFFITDLKAGRHLFEYYVRATHEGNFVAMPAEAYAMYDLATWGRSGSVAVVIAE